MTAAPTPIRECDAALDYLYGLLEDDAKARFEAHLASCARCQEELAAFDKVRAVARTVLEPIEPSERLTGALHAQLMHAAAQRKPRGKVVPFMRRVFQHPAYAAAAGILLIGGALGVEWSRGKLLPPSKAIMVSDEVAPSAAKPEPLPTVTAISTPKELPQKDAAKNLASPTVTSPPARTPTTAKTEQRAASEDLDRSKAGLVAERRGGKQDLDDLTKGAAEGGGRVSGVEKEKAASTRDGYTNGYGSDSSTRSAPTGSLGGYDSVAPAGPAPAKKIMAPAHQAAREEREPSFENQRVKSPAADDELAPAEAKPESKGNAQRNMPVSPQAAPTPVLSQGNVFDQNKNDKRESDRSMNAVGAATTPPADNHDGYDAIDTDRNRGNALAQAGRCEDAVAVYKSIERRVPARLTAQDRLSYERCLRTLGRLEPAQTEINALRANDALKNAVPAAAVQAEQKAINFDRKRQAIHRAVKAKRTAPTNTSPAPANSSPAQNNADERENTNRR